FFQAEDGIRDGHVTGVQTCALPIYALQARLDDGEVRAVDHERHTSDRRIGRGELQELRHGGGAVEQALVHVDVDDVGAVLDLLADRKSVVEGKSVDLGGRRVLRTKT